MKRDIAHSVAFIGLMTALMAVVLTLETYVFIYFIKPSPAFLSIPLFIALSMYGDWKNSFIGGTVFGCCSFAPVTCSFFTHKVHIGQNFNNIILDKVKVVTSFCPRSTERIFKKHFLRFQIIIPLYYITDLYMRQ